MVYETIIIIILLYFNNNHELKNLRYYIIFKYLSRICLNYWNSPYKTSHRD